jgi:hypothetical protein
MPVPANDTSESAPGRIDGSQGRRSAWAFYPNGQAARNTTLLRSRAGPCCHSMSSFEGV